MKMRNLAFAFGAVCLLLVGSSAGDVWNVDPGGGGDYTTIQAAVDAAGPGDTINVAAGTYAERLSISKSLTLLGPQTGVDPTPAGARLNSALEAVVTEAGLTNVNPNVLIEIPGGVTNVTIDGFTLVGDPTDPNADTSVVRCWDDAISIGHNIIHGKYGVLYKGNDGLDVAANRMVVNKAGVTVQPNAATDVSVSGNTFALGASPAGDESAIYMTAVTGAAVSGNTASGFINAKGIAGSNLTDVEVCGNVFTGNKDGVSFWGTTTNVTISGNDLSSSTRYGISIKGQDIQITGNEISCCGDTGVSVARHVIDTERVAINQNNIVGNASLGVSVDAAVTMEVNARCNWWGDAGGPGAGGANGVSGSADVSTWLDGPYPDGNCIPEPAALALLGTGGVGVLIRRRRRRA